jgi:hypothetical protein
VFVVASTEELAREVATIPAKPAPEAATRVRLDVGALLSSETIDLGEDDERLLRALVAGAEVSASAKDGDVIADAVIRWAR